MDDKKEFKNIIEIREYIRWMIVKAIIKSKILEDRQHGQEEKEKGKEM